MDVTPPLPDQLSILKLVTARLPAAGIPYMITGSIAAGHYAQPRMTRDLDFVVELEPADAERLVALFGDRFECDHHAIGAAIARRSTFNLIHTDAIVKVDFVVRKSAPFRLEEFGRRHLVDADGQPMWMVSVEDLVLSKLLWAKDSHSELQLRDVRHIVAAQPALDWAYVERWADAVDVRALVREVRP